jgi:hypothetical protein
MVRWSRRSWPTLRKRKRRKKRNGITTTTDTMMTTAGIIMMNKGQNEQKQEGNEYRYQA